MTDIIVIDIPDWQDATAAGPVAMEVVYVQILDATENNIIAVGYPGDWLTVRGGGNDEDAA